MRYFVLFFMLCIGFTGFTQTTAIPFNQIDTPPTYQGCNNASKEANMLCTQQAIEAFAKKKFNTGLFKNLNLNEKRVRVYAQFVIDVTGNIKDIKVRTAHPQLEKEAQRVLNLLNEITPGKHKGTVVATKYTLPLVFILG